MITRRVLALTLAASMVVGLSPAFAQQAAGTIGGTATDATGSGFNVQLRDAGNSQVVSTVGLTGKKFVVNNVELARPYLVELVQGNRVVCTKGPFTLSAASPSKMDVMLDCGNKKTSTALWLLAAGAGTAAAIAIATRSASK